MNNNALVIFAKNLIEGHVKTRLAITLGNDAAMNIYKQLLKNIHDKVQFFEADKIVFFSDFIDADIWGNNWFQQKIQEGNDLGEKMKNSFKRSFIGGYKKVIIIGTDCPGIDKSILTKAFAKLNHFDIVIGPARDGGYYLLGMKRNYPFLFQDIEWSTDVVLKQTMDLCDKNRLSYFLLPELIDIDEEKDLIHFENLMMPKEKS